jgi:hypothetical protein
VKRLVHGSAWSDIGEVLRRPDVDLPPIGNAISDRGGDFLECEIPSLSEGIFRQVNKIPFCTFPFFCLRRSQCNTRISPRVTFRLPINQCAHRP